MMTTRVPYFLLPSLGSGSTLRGYSSWRFRDRHSLLMSGEFRWIPNRLGLDMAMFYDTGKVDAAFWTTSASKGWRTTSASASGSTVRSPRRFASSSPRAARACGWCFPAAPRSDSHDRDCRTSLMTVALRSSAR